MPQTNFTWFIQVSRIKFDLFRSFLNKMIQCLFNTKVWKLTAWRSDLNSFTYVVDMAQVVS